MPSILTVPFLLAVIAVGVALVLGLLLATLAVRAGRALFARHRARVDSQVRPLVLAAVAGDEVPPEVLGLRGARGRGMERLIFGYLGRVRGEAHDRLAGILEDRGVVRRVLRLSRRPGRNRRATAASELGLIASAAAERRLRAMAINDHSRQVRIVAARGLGKTSEPEAAGALLGLLSTPDRVPEGIVASALLELGPEAVPALRRGLSPVTPPPTRAMAADLLGLLDDLPAWEALAEAAGSTDPEVRIRAVRALGRLGVPQATGAVSRCLAEDEDPALRAVAARALGRIGDPGCVPMLAGCLDGGGYWVAHNAAMALASLGQPGRQALAEAAAAGGPGAWHAREALTGLRLDAGPAKPAMAAGRQG